MKKISKSCKSIALLLAGALLLGGCGNTKGQSEKTSTMGRFVEQQVELPEMTDAYSNLSQEEGNVKITRFQVNFMVSGDEGKSFQSEPNKLDEYLQKIRSVNDRINLYDAVPSSQGIQLVTKYEVPMRSSEDGRFSKSLLMPDNKELEITGLSDEYMFTFVGDNDLFYVLSMNNEIYQINPETAEVTFLFQTEDTVGYVTACGKYLYAATYGALHMYDLEKKVLVETDPVLEEFVKNDISAWSSTRKLRILIKQGSEADSIYVVTEKGLYKHVVYGNTMEQIIDGSLCKISDSTQELRGMAALEDNTFLILFGDSLMRYTYDPDIPSVPENILRVYSLYEDKNVKLAINAYRQEHPETYIKYEVAVSDSTGVTQEDALKNLSTELAAGKGPDVLVMEGIPYESYVEKGVLADIGELVSGGEEEYFNNIIDGLRREEKLYTVPMAFSIPLLGGKSESIADVKTLTELADVMEAERKNKPEGHIINFVDGKGVLELFSLSSCGAWIEEDGSLNKEAVTEFLTDCKRIYDAQMSGIGETEIAEYNTYFEGLPREERFRMDYAAYYSINYRDFFGGYASGTKLNLAQITSLLRATEQIFITMPGQMENACIPISLLSVNTAAKMPEEAKSFIQYAISGDFQRASAISSAPINKTAYFDKQTYDPSIEYYLDGKYGSFPVEQPDGTTVTIEIIKARAKELKSFNGIVEGMEGAYLRDNRVYQAVVELGEAAMTGEASVEEAADAIEKKVQIYLAE